MLKTALAGLRVRKLRLLLTALAITLGVSFITGTFVLTDTMQAGYDQQFAASAGKISVVVRPRSEQLPAEVLAKVRALPGVTGANGVVRGDVSLLGRDGRVYFDLSSVGLSLPAASPLQRYDVVSGRAPAAAGEAVLDTRTAKATGFRTGETVTVLDHRGDRRAFRLVGTVDFGIDQEIGFRGAVGFDSGTAAAVTGERGFAEIDIVGPVARDAVAAAVGGSYEVLTGRQLGDRLAAQNGADTQLLRLALLLFGLVSLLVSAIVIYNTFAILIAQRMRELALLRCVGATRRQIFGGVLVESAVVGLVGSLLGVVGGAGLGAGALALTTIAGADPPAGAFTLGLHVIAIGLLAGVAVTVVSALLPARAATRVAPISALRTEQEPGTGRLRLGPLRIAAVLLPGASGLALTVLGAVIMTPGEAALAATALGGTLTFLGVIVLMPALVRPLARLVGALPAGFAGVPGRLAMENSRRAPKRTATTTIALTIGIGLVTLFAVLGASVKATAADRLERQFPVDYMLQAQLDSDRMIPRDLAATLRADPRIGSVTQVRWAEGRLNGTEQGIGTITQSAFGRALRPQVTSGALTELRPGTIALHRDAAGGRVAGQTVEVTTARGTRTLTVAAVFAGEAPLPGEVPLPSILVPERDFDSYFGSRGDTVVYVNAEEGVDAVAARAVVETATRPYPEVKVASSAALKDQISDDVDTLLMIFGGLLGLAILIALFGIANTLTLSVVERTRESALLRALGLTRRQLRWTLVAESVIMALIGALTGIVLGGAFGWAATRALIEDSLFRLPYTQIVGFVAVAALAGMIAAVLPARRAARASIVESLSAE